MDKGTGSRKAWEYVDFELEIGEGGPRRYPLTVRSPAGEAHEEMKFPFAEWELENKLLTVENTLLRSGETRRRIPSQEEQPVQDFGRSKLQALLVGEVRTRYAMSLLEARRQNKGLRLKLRIHPPGLARLPWEFLYDPDRDEYLSLSSKTPLVRYLDLHQPVEQLPVSPPLRILGMVSSPRDLPVLDVGYEKQLVEGAIRGLRTSSLIEMTWLEGQTWSDLQEALWGGPWHVFHFIGHGGFDEASQEGAIALADESGRKHLLGARNLARLLDDHYSLRLAVLNSCEGARSSVRDAFSSTAATLVRRGVPAVVAMQYEITDRAAIAFARVFYRAVADGLPVDAAVAAGRTAVSIDSALEWGTPVLYMRSPDGRVFDVSVSAPSTKIVGETKEAIPAHQEQATNMVQLDDSAKVQPRKSAESCPYRGLQAFNERDAELFFGRQRVVKKLLGELRREPNFLIVLGPSGSGKSSVIQAGLVPQLRKGKVLGIRRWGVVTISRYDEPFERLVAAGLEGASGEDLANAAGAWFEQHPGHERLLLILDQLEELLIGDPDLSRENFVTQLLRLLDSPHPITVVLVVQEAFYSRLVQKAPELTQEWLPGEGLVEISSRLSDLTREELINIVQKPATFAGLTFEDDRLVERIVNDAMEASPLEVTQSARTTVLPLLEYALSRLCENRQDGMLTHEAYDDIEGLAGHLTLWADKAYRSLAGEPQRLAQRILIDLVEPGDESRGLLNSRRRRRSLAELSHDESDSEAVQQVVHQLSKDRLLVTVADQAVGQEYVEIIHDVLLHEWRLLRRWLEVESRRFGEWRQNIEKRCQSWLETNLEDPMGRDQGELLSGPELAETEEWTSKRHIDLSQSEREFIYASSELQQQVAAQEVYRQAVTEAWIDEKLDKTDIKRLRDLVSNNPKLDPSVVSAIEREVMDATKEVILERQVRASPLVKKLAQGYGINLAAMAGSGPDGRIIQRDVMDAVQEQAAREKERKKRLDELYARARRSHQDQEWQVVVEVFEQIHADDPAYQDPEGLLASAHEALEAARKEEESHRQYREVVESAWANGELDSREVERLRDLADKLSLSPSLIGEIERTVTGDTKEAILESQERAAKERYREAVETVWADNKVSDAEVARLSVLASELGLNADTTAEIEREIMDGTKGVILERQTQAAREQDRKEWAAEEPRATSAARRRAEELGIDLAEVQGSGPGGLITLRDVTDGEPLSRRTVQEGQQAAQGAQDTAGQAAQQAQDTAGQDLNITDAARQKADELGVDLSKVEGTGAEGRITVRDVTSAAY
jgi:pyruvate/2-oxoglutarate dehydrogenase complex dihydrolipoamide acyltransferase (E2) component